MKSQILLILLASSMVAGWNLTSQSEPFKLSNLQIIERLDGFDSSQHILGSKVSNGKLQVGSGFWREGNLVATFGQPSSRAYEQGREYWCYSSSNSKHQHFYICLERYLGLIEVTHYEISDSPVHS